MGWENTCHLWEINGLMALMHVTWSSLPLGPDGFTHKISPCLSPLDPIFLIIWKLCFFLRISCPNYWLEGEIFTFSPSFLSDSEALLGHRWPHSHYRCLALFFPSCNQENTIYFFWLTIFQVVFWRGAAGPLMSPFFSLYHSPFYLRTQEHT